MVLTHPGLVVPLVTKWLWPTTVSLALKKSTVKRISLPARLYISYHWISNEVATGGRVTEGHVRVPLAIEIAIVHIDDRQ